MKVSFVFLVCCLAVTLAGVPQDRELINSYIKACQEEQKINDDVKTTATQENCFKACMFKKHGYLKADGNLDIDYMLSLAPEHVDKVKKRKEVVAKNLECEKKADGDTCILASCIFDDRGY